MTPTKSVSAFFFPEKQQTINLSKSPSTSSVNNISRHALKLMKKYFSKNELLNSTITGKQNHGTLDPDIIKRIKDFLNFNPNSFPIVLSFENHCSIPFQEVMAEQLVRILGKSLYIPPENSLFGLLPSPMA